MPWRVHGETQQLCCRFFHKGYIGGNSTLKVVFWSMPNKNKNVNWRTRQVHYASRQIQTVLSWIYTTIYSPTRSETLTSSGSMSHLSANLELGGTAGRLELLSIWNQSSPRVYISVILCFPFDNSLAGDAVQHLQASLERLAQERPLFAARLHAASSTEPGLAHLIQSSGHEIPFEVSFAPDDFTDDYEQIKRAGFPPGLFIGPQFGITGFIDGTSDPLPVSRVHALIIRGGLLLAVYLHHSLCDGDSLRIFLECFAAQTRGDAIHRPSEQAFDNPKSHRQPDINLLSLISRCPEYTLLPNFNGPTQPRLSGGGTPLGNIPKTGKIFVFKRDRVAELQNNIRLQSGSTTTPSTYTCLAALAFAHITKARLRAENFLPPTEGKGGAMLWNSVNWRSRAFQELTEDYFGNAALPAVTKASKQQLLGASDDMKLLATLVPLIKDSIDAVDEEYVRRRLALVSALPDPRLIGVNYDPRSPQTLAFNTWRHFGADAVWDIPGVPVEKPDAIRRAHGSWNLGTALILPARTTSNHQEIFVSLSQVAMDLLCQDEGWLTWVDRVIG
ncbi:anthranilate n-hydroxycinnamoyl/benzoyltransferase [Xylariales sp. AK1849]|nr:anthranilate n-hydroxycinnamoyl/benzoyltransferase [Xylariales sp. AK1849]